jgi:hypothetical protein
MDYSCYLSRFASRIACRLPRSGIPWVAVGATYGKGTQETVPALKGPTVGRVNPVGVGWSGGAAIRRLNLRLPTVGPFRGRSRSRQLPSWRVSADHGQPIGCRCSEQKPKLENGNPKIANHKSPITNSRFRLLSTLAPFAFWFSCAGRLFPILVAGG